MLLELRILCFYLYIRDIICQHPLLSHGVLKNSMLKFNDLSFCSMPIATRVVFKINNTFNEWAKVFDADRPAQEAAGIKPLFRGVSESDPSTVMAILEAEPGVSAKHMEGNPNVEASGHIIGSEEFSNWLPS